MHFQALWEYLRDDEVGKKKARLRKKTKVVAEPSSIAAMDGDEAVLKLLKRRAELDVEPASVLARFMFGSCVEADGVAKGWAYLSIAMPRQSCQRQQQQIWWIASPS